MGNEAGDLDSIASSIGFAYIQSKINKIQTIPLVQTNSDSFHLRPENIYALSLAGLTPAHLLTLTDISSLPSSTCNFALVDHNKLNSRFSSSTAKVSAIVDHHTDENLYPSANPRIIAPSGSCASHVALLCPQEQVLPPDLATLLLTAIFIDTNGLKPSGKALQIDTQASAFLAPRSTLRASFPQPLLDTLTDSGEQATDRDWSKTQSMLHKSAPIKQLTKALKKKKNDVSELSGRDLLRRDYKEDIYVLSSQGGSNVEVKVGLTSVPVSLKAIQEDEKKELEESIVSWVNERGLAVFGMLTSFKDERKKKRREMAWVVYGGGADGFKSGSGSVSVDSGELAERLWTGLKADGNIRVKKHDKIQLNGDKLPEGMLGRVFKQGNVEATRKVIAPALKSILEGEEVVDVKKEKKEKRKATR